MTMTESVSAAELAALIAGLTGSTPTPPPATVIDLTPEPCLDPFCRSQPNGGCGKTPNQHLEAHGVAATMPAAPRCTVTELLEAECSHCRPAPPRQESTLGPWFAASYKGECSSCGSGFDLFDQIRGDGEGGYLGPCCGNLDADRGTVPDPTAGLIAPAATIPATAPAATTTPAPAVVWLDSRYAGSCSSCGEKFAKGAQIKSDDAKGWIASCCANLPAAVVAAPPAGMPASTITELRQVLMDFEASRPRTMQTALGPSELGTPCQQQIARKLVGAPRQPITAPTWAPFQGTAVHRSMEDVVAHWNRQLGRERWLAEDRLYIDPGMPEAGVDEIAGSGDAFDQDHGMVVDWKHTGKTALDKLRRGKKMGRPPETQVSAEYRVQGHLYGLGHALKGRPVRWVRLVLLARSHDYDESQEWTEAYDENVAFAAIARYYGTYDVIDALGGRDSIGDLIGAVPAAPSRDGCHWCPFLRPGQPSNWQGCPGDQPLDKIVNRATDGLIEPATK